MVLPEKKLGFGLMRLPKKDDEIILSETIEMVDEFLSSGFTYFDTAYVYQGSEDIVRKAITERHDRDKYTVASKMAAWKLSPSFSAYDMFSESLSRTGLEYFDYYLIHSLQDSHMQETEDNGCWEAVRKLKAEGRIRHLGFSFHGGPELLRTILTEHEEMEFVQLQINFLDWDNPFVEAEKVWKVAREFNKPIVIMEPVKGGMLATVKDGILPPGTSAASLALRFAANLDGVMAVLSGMSSIEQMRENIATFSPVKPLDDEDRKLIDAIRESYNQSSMIHCTACRYCTAGCPMNIDIPIVFRAVNDLKVLGEHNRPRFVYQGLLDAGKSGKAEECIKCRKCEQVCPQHLKISELMEECSRILDKGEKA